MSARLRAGRRGRCAPSYGVLPPGYGEGTVRVDPAQVAFDERLRVLVLPGILHGASSLLRSGSGVPPHTLPGERVGGPRRSRPTPGPTRPRTEAAGTHSTDQPPPGGLASRGFPFSVEKIGQVVVCNVV